MVELNNVTFTYSKRSKLFDDVSLSLEPGKVYGLLGKNGTGKSTLLKLMTGVLMPQHGSCQVFAKDAYKRVPSAMVEFFIIPEEFYLPAVRMNYFVKMNAPLYPKFSHDDFKRYLNDFELTGNQMLNALSFGQKKKFLLAFGLATNVKLLFLDEPTNGLDIPSKSQFRKTVSGALTDEKSIIISTHQARDLESLIDTVIILENGKVVLNESCNRITQKLAFGKVRNLEDSFDVLYNEDALGGYKVVMDAGHNEESELDLELFFNAVVSQQHQITKRFEKTVSQYQNVSE